MKRKTEITLLRWLQRYWITVFLCMLAGYFPLQMLLQGYLEHQVITDVHNRLQLAEQGVETSLEFVDSFIYETLYNEKTQAATQLHQALRGQNASVERVAAQVDFHHYMISLASWSDMIDYIMLYTETDSGPYWLETGEGRNYSQRKETQKFIEACVEEGELAKLSRYKVCYTDFGNPMLRIMRINGSYFLLAVSETEMIRQIMLADSTGTGIAFALDGDGKMVFASQTLDTALSMEKDGKYVRCNGKQYLQVGSPSETTGYYFGILVEKDCVLDGLQVFQMLFFGVFMLLLITLPISFVKISRNVEKPITEFAATMNRIADGNLELTETEDHHFTELRLLASSFNHMIRRIQKLKIEKYEVQLEAQKAAMQYLQLQIKPHFYVNMLNIIYSLAERKEFAMIQKVSHEVVCFSRYMFRDASELVELRREVEHVQYYMEIQQIRYNRLMECSIQIPEEIRSAQVPPFVIQSFVENSAKYAFSANDVCRIGIAASTDAAKQILTICIRDNGTGYSEDYLNRDWAHKSEAEHIGLTNIHQRLKMIFGDRAEIRLYNDSGAVAEISMPYISVEDMDLEDE